MKFSFVAPIQNQLQAPIDYKSYYGNTLISEHGTLMDYFKESQNLIAAFSGQKLLNLTVLPEGESYSNYFKVHRLINLIHRSATDYDIYHELSDHNRIFYHASDTSKLGPVKYKTTYTTDSVLQTTPGVVRNGDIGLVENVFYVYNSTTSVWNSVCNIPALISAATPNYTNDDNNISINNTTKKIDLEDDIEINLSLRVGSAGGLLNAYGVPTNGGVELMGGAIYIEKDPTETTIALVGKISFISNANSGIVTSLIPFTTNSYSLGTSALRFKDMYLSGSASIAVDMTIDNDLTVRNSAVIEYDLGVNRHLTVYGNSEFGASTSDLILINASIYSNLIPYVNTTPAINIGSSSKMFNDFYARTISLVKDGSTFSMYSASSTPKSKFEVNVVESGTSQMIYCGHKFRVSYFDQFSYEDKDLINAQRGIVTIGGSNNDDRVGFRVCGVAYNFIDTEIELTTNYAINFSKSNVFKFKTSGTSDVTISAYDTGSTTLVNGATYVIFIRGLSAQKIIFDSSDFVLNVDNFTTVNGEFYAWTGVCVDISGTLKLYGVLDQVGQNLLV